MSGDPKKEVSILASAADRHLQEGVDHTEVLKAATEAVAKCYELGDQETMADMLRLTIKAYLLRAAVMRQEKVSGAQAGVAKSLKKAEQIAQGELALFRQSGSMRGQAAMLLSSAEILLEKGGGSRTAELATQAASQARVLYQKLGDKKMEAEAHLTLVATQRSSGEKQLALASATAALAIFREAGDKRQEAKALHAMAQARVVSDSYEAYTDGIQAAKDALAVFEELGDKREQANELLTIAAMNLERECPEQAIPPAKQAVGIFRQIGRDVGPQIVAVTTLIQACQALDDETQALNAAMESLAWTQNNGHKRQEIFLHDVLAQIHLKRGDVEAARAEVKDALVDARDLDDKELQGRLLLTMCQTQMKEQELTEALRSVKEAVGLFRGLEGAERDMARALHMRADVYCMSGQLEESMGAAEEARGFFQDAEDSKGEGMVLLLIAALQGASTEAVDTAVRAQELFKTTGEVRLESLALSAAVEIHLLSKDFERALELATVRRGLMEQAGFRKEEVRTLHSIVTVLLASGDAQEALARAREGSRMAKSEGDKATEVHLSIQLVHASVAILADAEDPNSRPMKSLAEEAAKVAKEAAAQAKKVAQGSLRGPALYWQGQILQMTSSPEATAAASGALSSFKRDGDKLGQAHSELLLGQCELAAGNRHQADQYLQDALALFVELNSPEGQAMVQSVMMQARPTEMAGYAPMMMMPSGDAGGAASQGPQQAIKKGPDPIQVKNTLRELVGEALETDDIAQDTPFMDSGLDSLASVSFRNEVAKKFSVSLPASLIFDYPTMTALTSYVVELLEDQ